MRLRRVAIIYNRMGCGVSIPLIKFGHDERLFIRIIRYFDDGFTPIDQRRRYILRSHVVGYYRTKYECYCRHNDDDDDDNDDTDDDGEHCHSNHFHLESRIHFLLEIQLLPSCSRRVFGGR